MAKLHIEFRPPDTWVAPMVLGDLMDKLNELCKKHPVLKVHKEWRAGVPYVIIEGEVPRRILAEVCGLVSRAIKKMQW